MFIDLINITRREKEIIAAISQGLNSVEISEKFFISIHTVQTHRKNILMKMDARNTAHMVRKSYELGLMEL